MICVTSVSVTPKSVSVDKGSWYYGLAATVLPSNATYKSVTWSSSNTNVATVNASTGYVYGNSAGTATIYATATDGSGKRDSCTVTVQNVLVSSISVSPSTTSLSIGETVSLSASVLPSNATNKNVTWSSSNTNVAIVSSSGTVTALSGGSATIYATATDGSGVYGSGTVTIDEYIPVSSIELCPEAATLDMGETLNLYADVQPYIATDKSVTWSSSNGNVATVSSNGIVTSHIPGNALITATSAADSNKKAHCLITVVGDVKVSSIEICPTSLNMHIFGTAYLYAAVYPYYATNKELLWITSDDCVATVSQSGMVTAVGVGITTIRAIARDGSGKHCSCTVHVDTKIAVRKVEITNKVSVMPYEEEMALEASVYPVTAYDKRLGWSSSNSNVVYINADTGEIHASNVGISSIKAIAQDGSGVYDSFDIEVFIPVASLNVEGSKIQGDGCITLLPEESTTLSATILPRDATVQTVQWESSNPNVATISSNGVITAHATGNSDITVSVLDKNGYVISKSYKVNVPEQQPPIDNGVTVSDPIDVYRGAHKIENTLMSLFGAQRLKLTVNYESDNLAGGIFGLGWHHNYEKRLEVNGAVAYAYISPARYIAFLLAEGSSTYICITPGKRGYILYLENSEQYPYKIDCNSQATEYYDADGRLAKIVDHQGFVTLIDYSDDEIEITDAVSGKKIYLEKNSEGKISKVYDDDERETRLAYDTGCLTEICDVNGNTLKYSYDAFGHVVSGIDSKGEIYFNDIYNESGKVSMQKDGINGSSWTRFDYVSENEIIVTDRNDIQSRYLFDQNGMLSSFTDGSGNTTTYEYDAYFNKIRETDAKGNSVQISYNAFNKPTMITDKNGNTTTLSYDVNGNITSITYPSVNGLSSVELFEYNNNNQITKHTDIRGTQTIYTYDVNGMLSSKKVGSKNAENYVYSNGLLISKTDSMSNTVLYGYNSLGQLISQTDAGGNITLYEYDASGNILKTTDANGKSIVVSYDGNYQKTSVTDACGNTTKYEYNANMKNTKVVPPDGNPIHYMYDGEDRVIKTIDQAGNEIALEYDASGRQITKREADGSTTRFEYDSVGNVIKEINSNGAVTTKTYDAVGNVLSEKDNNGNTTQYQYNSMSKVTKIIDALLGETTYSYSPSGDLLQTTDAMGGTVSYTYDAYGNKLSASDAKGNTTYYTYNSNDKLVSTTDALGNTTTYTYDTLGRLASVTDAKNHTITYSYDALGRRTGITDAKGNTFTTVYDANGNVLKTLDSNGNTISETVYNCLNLPVAVTDGAGKSITYTYNALGKVSSITDQLGRTKKFEYNSRGQITEVTDSKENTSTAAYDTLGNTTELRGPLGGGTSYSYDSIGRLISETTAYGGVIKYGYNALNLKESLTNARGQTHSYVYDALGRITQYTNAEETTTFTYDANGNVLTTTDSTGTITRTYDALNRVTSYTDTFGKTVGYEYDAVGNLAKLTYPDSTFVTYSYDENNNLISVTDWANRTTTYTYDSNNRVIGIVKPDGSTTTTMYDSCQRVVSTVERAADMSVISGFEYIYDALSNIICEKVLANGTKVCYTYDSLSRVTKRTVKDHSDGVISEEEFAYDAAGNIICSPENCSIKYDMNNKLESYDGKPVIYDADGNMLSAQIGLQKMTFEYDSANRLTSAKDTEYIYNAENVRIKKTVDEVETTYTYNTVAKLSQLLVLTKGEETTKFVYGLGLIGEEKSGNFKTYHFDYRGSTVAVTDTSGAVTDTFEYDTYGKLISRTGESEIFFLFNGRDGVITDENCLIYMRARYYLPELRRFINADIVSGDISNAITLNRYAYANGNPVSFVDPRGLEAERNKMAEDYFNINRNLLYELFSAFGIDFGKISDDFTFPLTIIDDQLEIRIKGKVSYIDELDIENNRGIETPNLTFFLEDVETKIKLRMDWDRIGLESAISIRIGEWGFKVSHVNGLKSELTTATITYHPTLSFLPSMSLSLEGEIGTLLKVGVAVLATAIAFAPEASVALVPIVDRIATAIEVAYPQMQNFCDTIIRYSNHLMASYAK